LKSAINVNPPEEWFRCACIPSLEIRLSRKDKEIGTILVYPDGLPIGFEPWSSDARISDREKWLAWFDARKIPGPRRGIEEAEVREKTDQANEARWTGAMPASLRPIWPGIVEQMAPGQDTETKILDQALAKEFPERRDRILALISWYGAGTGPWSGYPMYESVPEEMLLEYPTSELLTAIQSSPLSEQQIEGASRLFGGWDFNQRRPRDNAFIPASLKQAFLQHCLLSKDEDKVGRARSAFGEK
jgi:hypothetical protein